ncbi:MULTISPECIES: CsgG/HfaB family protein [Aequorivita]|uniref:Outer membrane beta-barrel protein n=1 Tax=Aequorivita iocasae TaxID=2803865 RepID=A0ABX7DTE2_9FLAO|nr:MULTISPECIES: CsgG/HfaB family protein [Aequorivita]QQX76891.1 outer membrane beta-barrel protein [Aequorivita iocasae]UCA56366.1 outer membrane beta-barrel protein [Aequorivita sp. F7]
MKIFFRTISLIGVLLFSSCGAYFNPPLYQEASRTGEFSKSTQPLLDLPPAAQPVEVAVYNFSDQTGQYKAVESGSTFSTAISQGGTTILIKALEDSGWFIPIERENLSNLSTERNIIRNTKQEYIKNLNTDEPPLPPLLYAGLLLEGGVISYDTNIITGGIGARYFGLGGSAKYRQDRITVYLRAVSTSNGEILKTVYVSKTILSQAIDASFFRFVKFQRLLEAETGVTQNEPVQLAMKDAIEKAVHDLIIEGIQKQFWSTQGGKEVNDQLVAEYLAEKEKDESTLLFDRLKVSREARNSLGISLGGNLPDNDYVTQDLGFLARLEYQKHFGRFFNANLKASVFRIDNGRQYRNVFASADLNGEFALLPNDKFTPFIYAGPGVIIALLDPRNDNAFDTGEPFFKVQYGVGFEYFISKKFGLKLFGEHNLVFTDKLEKAVQGKRNDFYYNIGVGLNYYFKL